jgi:spermidine synthase
MNGVSDAMRLRGAAWAIGAAAAIGQVMFARELLVAFLGNELTIGLTLAVWLTGIGVGAAIARRVRCAESFALMSACGALMAAAGAVMPLQFLSARTIRGIVGVPVGEVGSLADVLAAAAVVCLPTAIVVGMTFPLLCAAASGEGGDAATESGRLYGWESFGSMVAGVVLTWLLLPFRGGVATVAVGAGIAMLGAAMLLRRLPAGAALAAGAACILAGAAGGPLDRVETMSVGARWRLAGILSGEARLAASSDTVYQNLALVERRGQYTLYANGGIAATFPDPLTAEHEIHAIMAQKPSAKRVLLLGGNPLDDVRELLRHPLERLVHVDIDPGVGRIVRAAMPREWAAMSADRRLVRVSEDAPRHLKRRGDLYDVILVRAPDPSTISANRCFTAEFYSDAVRRLDTGGILVTSVGLSERMQKESASLGGSVYKAMCGVFPVVLVTAGARPLFLGGAAESDLTLDRAVLAGRSRAARIETAHFRPEYFFGTDDYDPEKVAHVRESLEDSDAPANTMSRPVATAYSLALWRNFSGTGNWAAVWVTAIAAVAALVWAAARVAPAAGTATAWVACGAVATTGLAAISIELLLLLLFQAVCGYVYTRIGLVFAVFMAGLALGARSGRRWSGGGAATWRTLAMLEAGVAALAGVVALLQVLAAGAADGHAAEVAIYAAVTLAGWLTGAEFPVVVGILTAGGGRAGPVVAAVDAADHAGAAVGAVATAALLVPWLGELRTAFMFLGVKAVSAAVCAAVSVSGRRSTGTRGAPAA